MYASLSVEERKVLLRSTEAKSDTANGMDQRIGLTIVDFGAKAANVNVNDIRSRVEVQVPYVLQQHGSRDHLADITNEIFQQLELSWQQFDLLAPPARDPG